MSSLSSSIQVASTLAPVDAQAFSFSRAHVSPRSDSWTDAVAPLEEEPYTPSPWNSVPRQNDWMGGHNLIEPGYLDDYNPGQQNMHPACTILPGIPDMDSPPLTHGSTGALESSLEPSRQVSASTSSARSAGSAATGTSEPRYDGQKYLQRLSEFNVRLSNPVGLNLDGSASRPVSPDQLEQAATHVLSSSAVFLDLVGYPSSCIKPCPVPDMAARLQLLVSYMRLTELHHGLYATVHDYLNHTSGSIDERVPQLGLSIAGVSLTPSPQFQLQLLLQTSTHYLGCIQEALGLPTPLRLGGTQ